MRLSCTSQDISTLPAALLADAKSHLRVEFTRDDSYIEGCVARAIATVQDQTDISINRAVWDWSPADTTAGCLMVPHSPLDTVLVEDADSNDVTSDYTISGTDSKANPGTPIITPAPAGLTVTLTVGYDNAADLPSNITHAILLLTGTYYEYREQLVNSNIATLPGWVTSMLANMWRSRA